MFLAFVIVLFILAGCVYFLFERLEQEERGRKGQRD
jgi:hypothetical protein